MAAATASTLKVPKPDFKLVGHMSKEPRLAGKVCIISGSNGGFGQAIAIRFVEEGGKVVVFSRSGCGETMELISKIEGLANVDDVALSLKCDISNPEQVTKMVEDTVAKFGDKIHVLVNNAARFIFHSVEHGSPEDWDNACSVNIKGHALVTKACLPYMKGAPGASIVFQGSISSFLGQPNCATYSVMKAAITQMARNCAYDFAKYGIRSNSVCAGTVETPISQTERDDHGWTYEHWESLKVKDVMLGRVGHVREIANATLFYASDESSYCTGGHLMVDGGQTACTVME
eukprot:m.433122 g.433122  ORF g.433122 m.433122 type:complete len:289 (+) comp17532_c0_seq1:126-992(+)